MHRRVTVVVEDFPRGEFRQPESRETTWGTAVRAEEAGKLFDDNGLFIEPRPADAHLDRHLPREWRAAGWRWLVVGGWPLENFEHPADEEPSPSDFALIVLRELLLTLLEGRPRWAVFVTRNDDEAQGSGGNIERRYRAVDGLAEAVADALRQGGTAVSGLCFLPTAAEKKSTRR